MELITEGNFPAENTPSFVLCKLSTWIFYSEWKCLYPCASYFLLKKNSPPPSTPTFSLLNPIAENYLAFLWVQLRNSSVISLLSSPNLGFLMSVHGLRGRWGFPKYQTSLGNPFEPLFLDRADICIWLSEQTGRCYTRDGHWKACSIRLPKQIQ